MMAKLERKRRRLQTLSILASITVVILLIPTRNCHSTENITSSNELKQDRSNRFSLSSLWSFESGSSTRGKFKKSKNDRAPVMRCGHRLQESFLRSSRTGEHYRFRHLLEDTTHIQPSGRIVGGRIATIKDFPWIVSLQREKNFWFGFRAFYHSCGGSLITPSWILTAAHCLYNRDEPLRAVAGTDNMNYLYRAQIRSIQQQIYHPDFDISSYDNDIALIKVDEPFKLDSSFSQIGLVCLDPETPILPYDIATICGFGARAFHQKARSHLYETEIAIIDDMTCNSSFGNAITDNMLCAGGMIENKRDACSGDSGGPLTLQDLDGGYSIQIGVVSFGNDCAMKNFPGIYTRLSNYYDWILNHIDEPLPEP